MRILLIQSVGPEADRPVFDQSLGILSTLLKYDGFQVDLLSLSRPDSSALHKAVVAFRPQAVVAHVSPRSFSLARRNLVTLAEAYPLPVLAVGPYATVQPGKVITYPGVTGLIVGEYERPAAAWLAALRDRREPEGIAGLWASRAGRLARNRLGGLVRDLDELPHPDRTIFRTTAAIERTGVLPIKVARGCSRWCAYCVNDWYQDLYDEPDHHVRRRSVPDVIEEATGALATWPKIRRVDVLDHAFATDRDWLADFSADWNRHVAAPFRCHLRLADVDDWLIETLAAGGCTSAHTQIGSGSSFIRNEIFSMQLSDEQIRRGCRLLAEAGIALSADVFVGCPYETEISLEATLELLWSLPLDGVDVKIFHPFPGTRAAELSRENGWISARSLRVGAPGRAVLDMPSLWPEQIVRLARSFDALIRKPGRRRARRTFQRLARRRR